MFSLFVLLCIIYVLDTNALEIMTVYSWDEGQDVRKPCKTCSDVGKEDMDINVIR